MIFTIFPESQFDTLEKTTDNEEFVVSKLTFNTHQVGALGNMLRDIADRKENVNIIVLEDSRGKLHLRIEDNKA